jgi:hypothetical protein
VLTVFGRSFEVIRADNTATAPPRPTSRGQVTDGSSVECAFALKTPLSSADHAGVTTVQTPFSNRTMYSSARAK